MRQIYQIGKVIFFLSMHNNRVLIVVPEDNLNWLLIDQLKTSAFRKKNIAVMFEKSTTGMLQAYCKELKVEIYDNLAGRNSRFGRCLAFSSFIRKSGIKTVIIHSYPLGYLLVTLRILNPKVKTIFVRHHNLNHHLMKRKKSLILDRIIVFAASYVIAVSNSVRNTILKEYPSAKDKVSVVYNGVDLLRLKSSCVEVRSITESKEFEFIVVGRLEWQKNYPLLIDCLNEFGLKDKNYKIRIFGVGGQEYENNIRSMVKDLKLSEKISFLGWDPSVTKEMYNASAILHTAFDEACPLVIVEALLLGVPIIAFSNGGTGELQSLFGLPLIFSKSDFINYLQDFEMNYLIRAEEAMGLISKAEILFNSERCAQGYLQILDRNREGE
jgi:glycosyltransferase involved in cell wall biosynthesis